jgi:hypothetical protein
MEVSTAVKDGVYGDAKRDSSPGRQAGRPGLLSHSQLHFSICTASIQGGAVELAV